MILNMKNPWGVMMMLTNESSLTSDYECYDGVVLWGRACMGLEALGGSAGWRTTLNHTGNNLPQQESNP